MNTMDFAAATLLLSVAGSSQTSQFTTIPPAYAVADAPGLLWLPGSSHALRKQQIIGAPLLQGLVGRTLTALEFRRNAMETDFQAGQLDVELALSVTPRAPLLIASEFAANPGPAPVAVFQGQLQLPASPGTLTPDWSPQHILRIPFQVPFVYTGGHLCVDLVGTPVAGQAAGFWAADAERSPLTATVVDLGGGCGLFGGPHGRWSAVERHSLTPGGHAQFYALGPTGSFAIFALGSEDAAGWPLSLVLPAAPGCRMHVALPIALQIAPFEDNLPISARADHVLPIPVLPALTGVALTAQWIEWTQPATSNAISWTIGAVPSIQMAHVDGHPSEAAGTLFVDLAHVIRFEHD